METTHQNLNLLNYIDPHPKTNYKPDHKLFVEVQKFLGLSDLIMLHFIHGAKIQKIYYYISINNELICQNTKPLITPNEKNGLNNFAQTATTTQFKPVNNDYEGMLTTNILNAKKVWQTKIIVEPEFKIITNLNRMSFENKHQFLNAMLSVRQQFKEVYLHHIATLMDIKAHLPLNDMLKTYHDKKYEDLIPYVTPHSFVKQIHYTTDFKKLLCPKCKHFYGVYKELNRSVEIGKKEVNKPKGKKEIEYQYEHFYNIQFINNPDIKFSSQEEQDFYTLITTYYLQELIGDEKLEFGKKYFDKHENNLSVFEFGIDNTHYNFQTCLHKSDYYLSFDNLGNDYANIKKHIQDVVSTTTVIGGSVAAITHSTIGLAAAQSTLVALPGLATATVTAKGAAALASASTITSGALAVAAGMTPIGIGISAILLGATAIKIIPPIANDIINIGSDMISLGNAISHSIIYSNPAQLSIEKIKQCTPWLFGAKKNNAIFHAQCTQIKEYVDIKMACLIETGHVNCVTTQEFVEIFFDDNWESNLQFYQPRNYKNDFKNLASKYTDKIYAHTKDSFGVVYK